jgi:hypothetical protein
MTKNKKSFIIHWDSLDALNDLTDEQAGKLFKGIKELQNNINYNLDGLLNAVLTTFRNQIRRDLQKYDNICKRNAANGLKGGRPKNPKNPDGYSKNPKKPKKADSDNDNDNDSDNNTPYSPPKGDWVKKIWELYPSKTGKRNAVRYIRRSLKEFSGEEILKKVKAFTEHYESWHESNKKFIPNGSTFFNQEKWNDDLVSYEKNLIDQNPNRAKTEKEKNIDYINNVPLSDLFGSFGEVKDE